MERRTLLKRLSYLLGALYALLLGVPGVAYLIDPRNRKAPARRFKRIARLSELPKPQAGNPPEPREFVVRDEFRRDAWTLYPTRVVGKVWLLRENDDRVVAFTSICPHLGCSINYDGEKAWFVCPCHNGTFDLSGQRVGEASTGITNPAPRGMDELRVAKTPIPGEEGDFHIEVEYLEFRQGLHERVVKA